MNAKITPRLASSKQWTTLPVEFTSKVTTIFTNQFKLEATRGEFLVEGWIFPEELIMRVGYLETGRLKQVNFEASMDIPRGGMILGADDFSPPKTRKHTNELTDITDEAVEAPNKTMDALYTCIDALGSLVEEYFQLGEGEVIDVPIHWSAFEFEDEETVYLQHSTVNTRLEAEADRLLGLDDSNLFQETSASEDALANAEIDSELAAEVQKVIRAGKHPLQKNSDTPSDEELN